MRKGRCLQAACIGARFFFVFLAVPATTAPLVSPSSSLLPKTAPPPSTYRMRGEKVCLTLFSSPSSGQVNQLAVETGNTISNSSLGTHAPHTHARTCTTLATQLPTAVTAPACTRLDARVVPILFAAPASSTERQERKGYHWERQGESEELFATRSIISSKHTHMYTHTHTHIHTNTQTHKHTHKHTHKKRSGLPHHASGGGERYGRQGGAVY